MVHVKDNFKNMHKKKTNGLACESCNTVQTETQAHVLRCLAYDKLREGLTLSNQDDLIKYFREVMMVRDKLGRVIQVSLTDGGICALKPP